MAIEEDLVYPLIVLGVGSLITAYLVPKISGKYQDKQKEIDRAREDRRYELEVKKEILTSVGKVHHVQISSLWGGTTLTEGIKNISKEKIANTIDEIMKNGLLTERLIKLYYGDNPEIIESWEIFMANLIDSVRELEKEPVNEKQSHIFYHESEEELVKFEKLIKKTRPAFIG